MDLIEVPWKNWEPLPFDAYGKGAEVELEQSGKRVRVSLRDPDSDKYVGTEESWQRAQESLVEVCENLGIDANQNVYATGHFTFSSIFVSR